MTDNDRPVKKRIDSAAQHLAAVRAASIWHQELIAAHLLRDESPIRDLPLPPETEVTP